MFRLRYFGFYYLVLDIETSTEKDAEGKPVRTWLSYGVLGCYGAKKGVIHHRFRTWEELRKLLEMYNRQAVERTMICYVHNLAYEGEFLMRNVSEINSEDLIAAKPHSPIQFSLTDFPFIIFRDTLIYTQKSLAKVAKDLGTFKLDSDYRTIYPDDDVLQVEWKYCERDVDIVALLIRKDQETYDRPFYKLPLTSTGKIREKMFDLYAKYESSPDWDVLPPIDHYRMFERAFYGGVVIANPEYVGKIVPDVFSYDRTSAYPYSILAYNYPRKMVYDWNLRAYDDKFPDSEFWIGDMILYGVKSKFAWGWLPSSRIVFEGKKELFNGKVITAECIVLTLTNVDFASVLDTYDVDGWEFTALLCGKGEPLPRQYIDLVQVCAQKKSALKAKVKKNPDDLALAAEYQRSKGELNSVYGCCVENYIRNDFVIDSDFNWNIKTRDYPVRRKHYKRSFLFGIYITAYARRDLLRACVKNHPEKLLYTDTDSIKTTVPPSDFVEVCEPLGPEFDDAVRSFGLFECEHNEKAYEAFRTWGAKKYAVEDETGCHMTVAGLPKPSEFKTGVKIASIQEFSPGSRDGKLFPKCKLARAFLTQDGSDGLGFGGCALYEVGYTLGITDNDLQFIYSHYGRKLW